VLGGFIPNPFERVNEYAPTATEILIVVGVYAVGALIATVLYKIALGVREELESPGGCYNQPKLLKHSPRSDTT
jgi:Ni/Fe-hydrogenase subunit HybB-like protein